MLFVDYTFEVLDNGTIFMDKELSARSLNLKNGDRYIVSVTFEGRVIFQKVRDDNDKSIPL